MLELDFIFVKKFLIRMNMQIECICFLRYIEIDFNFIIIQIL